MTPAAQRQLGQLLAVVALLFGLLAMHGLASEHHAPALALTPSAAAAGAADPGPHHTPAGTTAPGGTATAMGALEHDRGPARAAAPVPADAGSSCHAECPDQLAALCLAVLSAGAAALAVLPARQTRPLRLPALPVVALPRPGPPLRLRPPDPVRDLCISRT